MAKPDFFQAKRILCVQPHYDDNDLCAGGTLALLSERGAELLCLTVTDDLVGVVDADLPDEQAAAQLKQEQRLAGEITGVREHFWLGLPDAGDYSYFELRRRIIAAIRRLRPDFLFTCDPWLPYEAHRDHIQTGFAVSEASYLQAMPRLKIEDEIDRSYQPYTLQGVAFYSTHAPNTWVDIEGAWERKRRAIACYKAQFRPDEMENLLKSVDDESKRCGQEAGLERAEAFKVLRPDQLHLNTRTWQL